MKLYYPLTVTLLLSSSALIVDAQGPAALPICLTRFELGMSKSEAITKLIKVGCLGPRKEITAKEINDLGEMLMAHTISSSGKVTHRGTLSFSGNLLTRIDLPPKSIQGEDAVEWGQMFFGILREIVGDASPTTTQTRIRQYESFRIEEITIRAGGDIVTIHTTIGSALDATGKSVRFNSLSVERSVIE